MLEHPTHDRPEQKERKSTFFLLSLLIHLILFYICFLFIAYQNSYKIAPNERSKAHQGMPPPPVSLPPQAPSGIPPGIDTPPEPQNDQKKELPLEEKEEPAQLVARQSAFGAPVIFQDMPESVPAVATNPDYDGGGHDTEEAQEERALTAQDEMPEQKLLEKSQETDTPTSAAPLLAKQIEKQLAAPGTGLDKQLEVQAMQQTQELPRPSNISQEEKKQQRKQQQALLKPKRKRNPSSKGTEKSALNEGNSIRSAGPTDKKFTFADLANGFMENLQSGGKDAINQRGNPNKRASIEQLKQASYKQKMAWNLQAAFKRAARRTKFIIQCPEYSKLECTFYITKDGELEKLDILSSTGHQELDSYIASTVKDAFPLPPIPDHWAQEMLVQHWVFRNVRPDESSYTVNF